MPKIKPTTLVSCGALLVLAGVVNLVIGGFTYFGAAIPVVGLAAVILGNQRSSSADAEKVDAAE